jgi:hypothetical protein
MAIPYFDRAGLGLDGRAFIGELALDGSVRSVTGVVPMARLGSRTSGDNCEPNGGGPRVGGTAISARHFMYIR